MKKRLLSALLLTMGIGFLNAQTIIEDFETGLVSVNSIPFRHQTGTPFNIMDCAVSPTFGNNLYPGFQIYDNYVNKASITLVVSPEPILGSFGINYATAAPGGGLCALRLNDVTGGGYDITAYEKAFVPTENTVSFDYMLVYYSDHSTDLSVQPFFTARLLDGQGNIIPGTQFCKMADPADPLLMSGIEYLYHTQGWYCGALSIPDEYIGQQIRIQFITSDCGGGLHLGTAYIDNIINGEKCSAPEYGQLILKSGQYDCSPQTASVCGSYIAPYDSYLSDLQLEILQNGIPVSVNPGAINVTWVNTDEFCFNIDFNNIGTILTGDYEFRVIASFTSNSNGFIYTLTDESINTGADVSFYGSPAPITYIDFNNQTVSWPNTGGPYYVEFAADSMCCPSAVPVPNTTSSSMTTSSNSMSFYDGINLLQRKCLRFRIKTQCSDWSQWCCITSYDEEEGGYEIITPGESFDCTDEYTIQNLQARAYVYPNTTSGNITVKNSNSLNFEVYDYTNNLVLTKKISEVQEEVVLDLHNLKQGIYILKTDQGHTIKVIKN